MFNQKEVQLAAGDELHKVANMPTMQRLEAAGYDQAEPEAKLLAKIQADHNSRNQLLEQLAETKHQFDLACLDVAKLTERKDMLLKQLTTIIERLHPLMDNLTSDPSSNGRH